MNNDERKHRVNPTQNLCQLVNVLVVGLDPGDSGWKLKGGSILG